MKITFPILFLIFFIGSITVSAQETDPSTSEAVVIPGSADNSLNEDMPLLYELENKLIRRDSSSIKQSTIIKSKSDQRPSVSSNDDALSFNFLYYIIKKFKISDLIDN